MNWDYLDLSIEEFLDRAFNQAKRLEIIKMEYSSIPKKSNSHFNVQSLRS